MAKKKSAANKTGQFITIEMLAEKKGLTVAFLRKAKTKYGLPFYKFGNSLRFIEKEFDMWALDKKKMVS